MTRAVLVLLSCLCTSAAADDWPQWGGPQRDLIWREQGICETLPVASSDELLPRVWSVPLAEGYSGPAVAAGRVYVTDRLNEDRTERLHCVNAETGQLLWSKAWPARYTISYPAGPRVTPTVDADRVYVLGAVGDLLCFSTDGELHWQSNFPKDFGTELPTWGTAAAPLVDGDQLICLVGGSDGSLVVSFDKKTGRELWRALDDPAVGYCPPVIYEFGGIRQLIIWHPAAVSALNPETGDVLWEHPWTIRAGLTVPMPRRLGDRLLLSSFYNGSTMLQVTGDSAQVVWKGSSDSELRTDGLHSIMPTPVFREDCIFGICSYGQLRGLDTATGERLWETRAATGEGRWWNAFLIPHNDRFFIHNEQGDLIIAHLSADGYEEISRARLVEPTRRVQRRMTIWSHPAFAMGSVFARNDKELVRVNLTKDN